MCPTSKPIFSSSKCKVSIEHSPLCGLVYVLNMLRIKKERKQCQHYALLCTACFINQHFKHRGFKNSKLTQHFSIQRDIGFFQSMDQGTISHIMLLCCGINTGDKE